MQFKYTMNFPFEKLNPVRGGLSTPISNARGLAPLMGATREY